MSHAQSHHLLARARRAWQADWTLYHRRRMDRSTRVIAVNRLPLFCLLLLIGLAVLWPARVWAVLLGALGFVVGGSLLWMLMLATRLYFSRELVHSWRQVGDRLEESFELVNGAFLPALLVEVEDGSNLPGYSASTVRRVPPLSVTRWSYAAISQRRGEFRLGPDTVRVSDPFGIFRVEQTHSTSREILVYPPILDHMRVTPPAGGGHGERFIRRRTLEETAATSSVRDYAPGDPIRRIHWPLSQRHQSLLVKEFDRDVGGDVWLLLDLHGPDHVGAGAASTLEEGVVWAASLTWHLIRQGSGVGLFACGPQRILLPPAKGSAQLWHILRALAPVTLQDRLPLSAQLEEVGPLIRRGHALAVITPSTAADWPEILLRPALSGISREVILLDPALFQPDSAPSGGESLRALLVRQGIPVRVAGPEGSRLAVPAAPGGGDWKFTVTGFGKVHVRSRPERVTP